MTDHPVDPVDDTADGTDADVEGDGAPGVRHDVALHCLDELGRPLAFMATFSYDPTDPYAVWLTFHVPAGDVRWALCRSLLACGLAEPAGEGDVSLAPGVDEDGASVLRLEFCSPAGRLLTHAASSDLWAFLHETWALVPAGTEARSVDLDLLVEQLRLA